MLVGITMQGYAWLVWQLPPRWALPLILMGFTGCLVLFWLLFRGDVRGVCQPAFISSARSPERCS